MAQNMLSSYGEKIKDWVENVVLKLNLCPFAHDMWNRGDWAIWEYSGTDKGERLQWTEEKISDFLKENEQLEGNTVLLIYPQAKENFIKFYNFSAMAEDFLERKGLKESVQLVTFHPQFRFEGEKKEARGNYVNRSPYPLLHLLWSKDVSAVLEKLGENIGEKVAQENNNKLSSMSNHEFEEKVMKYVRSSWKVEKLS